MKIHWLQHVPFEGLGCIQPWLTASRHAVTCTRLWAGDELPEAETAAVDRGASWVGLAVPASRGGLGQTALPLRGTHSATISMKAVDGLIVMGGPMGVYDEAAYPWLTAEKAFIKEIIAQNKPVLGICLGAQLIADVLGAEVRSAGNKEIGFFPIIGNPEHEFSKPWKTGTVFHWHGDTFSIPDGAVHLASSVATENQAFIYKNNVLALQFHLETTEESLLSLYKNCFGEITAGPFIQTVEEMQPFLPMLGNCNRLMFDLLKRLF